MGFISFKVFLLGVCVCALQPTTAEGFRNAAMANSKQVTKIVGGEQVEPGEIPYQLSLQVDGYHFCGASLVQVHNVQLAVTAAHCVFGDEPFNFVLVAGQVDLSVTDENQQTRQVTKIVVHEDYDPYEKSNDLALLFFADPFELNTNVAAVALPYELNESFENVTVSGWGSLQGGGPSPDRLQKITTPVIDQDECKAAWQPIVEITDGMICTGDGTVDQSPCHGDSGGPAAGKGVDGDYLIGVVSLGDPLCDIQYLPAVFTKVAKYVGWIQLMVENE